MLFSFRPQALVALAGVALLLIMLILSVGAGNPLSPLFSPSSSTSQPSSGSTYVEAMVGAPRFVNPLLAVSDTDTDLTHLIYSGLTRIDNTGNLAPDLAQSWDAGPDSRVFTFTLKSNLKWQDGEPLTADDVLFTLDLLRRPDFPGNPVLVAPWQVVTVQAPSRQTVVFRLPQPNASFIQYTTLGILPQHLWGSVKPSELISSDLNRAPVGSGPWRYKRAPAAPAGTTGSSDAESATPAPVTGSGDGVLLEPNPYSANPENRAISRIWFRLYPSFGAALTGFSMGEVHGLGHIPAERIAEVAALPGVTMHRQNLARYSMLLLNLRAEQFSQPEIRRAVSLAIDRDALVRDAAGGEAEPLAVPILPHSWAYDPTLAGKSGAIYDPAQARNLLDAAGWKVGPDGVRARAGVTLTLVLAANSDVPQNVAVANSLTASLRAVGFDVQPAAVGRDVLLRDYLGPRAFHMALVGWEAQGDDPDVWTYWHSSQADISGGLNFSGWSDPTADKALDDARNTPTLDARAKSLLSFQRAFLLASPAIILYTPLYAYATHAPATGVTLPQADILQPAQRFDTIDSWSIQPPRLP